ncbi:MAG: DUF1549 domain-containing protein [Planctomycetaceae bacterium]|nr:DUF1549 domain-containing protein [Planctomycetaceae bacterium]
MKYALFVVSLLASTQLFAEASERPPVVDLVDSDLRVVWGKYGISPAPPVDDAGFLRRLTLDLTGRLPQPQAVEEFLDDASPDKRARAVDRLLASPEYAEHWATYWDNLLMGRLTREAFLDRAAFKQWLRAEFAANTSWDQVVRKLITAEGYNTNRRPARGGSADPKDLDERFNPAANWFLRYSRALPDMASATSKLFLGVQIQCAQCHDHKSEKWKQDDFKQFAACFAKTWPTYVDSPQTLTRQVGLYRMELKDRLIVPPVAKYESVFGSYKDYIDVAPKLLDGTEVRTWGSRRKIVADWVTNDTNPWFAQAIVNRLWGKLLGRGFVEPIDDFRPGNPALLPATLDALATDFRAHRYDLRHLLRAICLTEAYGRACVDLELSAGAPSYWAAYPVKALDVEELFDAVTQATDGEAALNRISKNNYELIRGAFVQELVTQMGTDDMAEVTELDETIPRSLLLINGALVCGTTRHSLPDQGLAPLLAQGDEQAIEQLYLRTLSRRPTAAELSRWLEFTAKPRTVVVTKPPVKASPPLIGVTKEIAEAAEGTDFTELLKHAQTAADFAALRGKMENNADAALYAKAFRTYVAETPFNILAALPGGKTAKQQAFEDLYWALLNSTEFLTNH